jgi:hypothetical protein
MSHHGQGAGPVPGVNYNNVKYIRGVGNVWAAGAIDPLNSPVIDYKSSQPPVIENSIERCFSEATKMNKADLVPTLFFHSNELVDEPLYDHNLKKSKFDHFVNAVVHRNIEAVSYLEAMTKCFMDVSIERRFRVSASERVTLRRAQVDYIIEDSSGTVVETAENSHTKLFTLPIGAYTVKAKVDGELKCSTPFTLTPAGGVHVIVYV